jgi:hypothetical protein
MSLIAYKNGRPARKEHAVMGMFNWFKSAKRYPLERAEQFSASVAKTAASPESEQVPAEADVASAGDRSTSEGSPEKRQNESGSLLPNSPTEQITIEAPTSNKDLETKLEPSAVLPDTPELPKQEIRLRLARILEALPLELERPAIRQFTGTDACIALPLAPIQAQLATGRVVIPFSLFLAALPVEIREAFGTGDGRTSVPIPLQEIFRELPPDLINLRQDQVVESPSNEISTPFAEHAREDAARFAVSDQTAAAETAGSESEDTKDTRGSIDFSKLQALLLTDEELDLPKVVTLVSRLPDVKRCLLTTLKGHPLSGDLGEVRLNRAATFLVPQLFTTANHTLSEIDFAPLQTVTLHFGEEQLSSFVHGALCLTILHSPRPLRPGVRETIRSILIELAKNQPD